MNENETDFGFWFVILILWVTLIAAAYGIYCLVSH